MLPLLLIPVNFELNIEFSSRMLEKGTQRSLSHLVSSMVSTWTNISVTVFFFTTLAESRQTVVMKDRSYMIQEMK